MSFKDDLKEIPSWAWLGGAAGAALLFVVAKARGSSSTTASTAASTPVYDSGTTSTSGTAATSNTEMQDLLAILEALGSGGGTGQTSGSSASGGSTSSSSGSGSSSSGTSTTSSGSTTDSATQAAAFTPTPVYASSGSSLAGGSVIQTLDGVVHGLTQSQLDDYSNGNLVIAINNPNSPALAGVGAQQEVYDPNENAWIPKSALINGQFPGAAEKQTQSALADQAAAGNRVVQNTPAQLAAGNSVGYDQMVAYQKAGMFPNAAGQWTVGGK